MECAMMDPRVIFVRLLLIPLFMNLLSHEAIAGTILDRKNLVQY